MILHSNGLSVGHDEAGACLPLVVGDETALTPPRGASPLDRISPRPDAIVRAGEWLFRNRGWIPAPLAVLPLLGPGHMTSLGWIAGGAAMVAGEALRIWGVAAAGPETRRRSRDVARLVTHGPFAFVRNPIYLGNLFLWLGFGIVAGTPWFVPAAATLFAVEYGLIVRFEERVLVATFGEVYERYLERTPRWLPWTPGSQVPGGFGWGKAVRREAMTVALVTGLLIALAKSHVIG